KAVRHEVFERVVAWVNVHGSRTGRPVVISGQQLAPGLEQAAKQLENGGQIDEMLDDVETENDVVRPVKSGFVEHDFKWQAFALGAPSDVTCGVARNVEIGSVEAAAGKGPAEVAVATAKVEDTAVGNLEQRERVHDVAVEQMMLAIG